MPCLKARDEVLAWAPWVPTVIIPVHVVLLVGIWAHVRNRRWLKILSTYEVVLGDDTIIWKQAQKPDVEIRRKQITHL